MKNNKTNSSSNAGSISKSFKIFWVFGLCLLSTPILSVTMLTNVFGTDKIQVQLTPSFLMSKTTVSSPVAQAPVLAQTMSISSEKIAFTTPLAPAAKVKYPKIAATRTESTKNSVSVSKVLPKTHLMATASRPVDCKFMAPEKTSYAGRFLSVTRKGVVSPGENFQVEVKIENTGNMPWFSAESGCTENPVFLGTEKVRDRSSLFATDLSPGESHWMGDNRITMETNRVSPLGIAVFSFWAKAPQVSGLYREYFAPVVEGKNWIEGEALFSLDVQVGEVAFSDEQQQYLPFIQTSMNLAELDLSGEKKIEVDLSEQKMYVKIGDTMIRTFLVSSGARKTPTPSGKYEILLKQDVRVGGKAPHYIMPRFMMFRKGGYGFHSLPSLGNDRGLFWTEALNHIGTPRSHGCVRLLPEDSEFVYGFADIGTKVEIYS